MNSNSRRLATTSSATLIGALIGWALGGTAVWALVGGVSGGSAGVMIAYLRVRPVVGVSVAVGAGVGSFIGATIVRVLCEPEGCPAFEAGAGLATGIGALVGIGLVVALATRSFDEHREQSKGTQTEPNNNDTL